MNLDEVLGEIIERRCCGVILQLARESVAQARVAPTVGSECPILLFLPSAAASTVLSMRIQSAGFSPDFLHFLQKHDILPIFTIFLHRAFAVRARRGADQFLGTHGLATGV